MQTYEADSSGNIILLSFFLIKKKLSTNKLFGGSERRPTVRMEGVMSRPFKIFVSPMVVRHRQTVAG
jgi:hypothetical protein